MGARFNAVMKKWLRPSMTMMALLALFALVMPSLAWACPVTGRTGDMTAVCDRSPSGAATVAMSCCMQMQAQGTNCLGQCCKSVPQLPNGDKDKGNSLAQTHANTASLLSQISQAAHTTLVVFTLPDAPLIIEPTRGFAFGDAPSDAHLLAQYAPAAFSGRAPPLS